MLAIKSNNKTEGRGTREGASSLVTEKDRYHASTYLPVNTNVQEEKCCEWNNCVHNEVEVSQVVTNVDLIHSQTSGLKRGGGQQIKDKWSFDIFLPLVLPSRHLHNRLFHKNIPPNRNLDPE